MTDERRAIIKPFSKPDSGPRRRNRHSLREAVNAVCYFNANGCKSADLPHDFPLPPAVSPHDCKWVEFGPWRRVNDALREAGRIEAGRDPRPAAGRSIARPSRRPRRVPHGTTTGPRTRPATSGTSSWIPRACRWPRRRVRVRDRRRGHERPRHDSLPEPTHLRVAFADSAYHREDSYDRVASKWYRLRIAYRPADAVGFVVLPMRWKVERTFGWIVQSRRHAKDYERTFDSSEAPIYITSARLLLHRLRRNAEIEIRARPHWLNSSG